MERNYEAVNLLNKWYVEYEYYDTLEDKWVKNLFKDWNNENLEFYIKQHADDWIEARIAIMKIHL